MLYSVLDKIKKNKDLIPSENLDWDNYEFGKNFYNNIVRDEIQTDLETSFILEKLRLKSNSKILDLGCGGGRNSFALNKKGFIIEGIDLNKYAIEQANLNATENTHFHNKNILDIDYKEEFNSVLLIFNHFSIFNKNTAKKLLKKIENALVKDGKVLIEIQSLNGGQLLDKTQEWFITDSWISGDFNQLVLIENSFDFSKNIHTRTDYCINSNTYELSVFNQKTYLYDIDDIYNLFSSTDLKIKQIYGDWEGKIFEEDDDIMIITAQK
ncbi:MAG: class I SAM-dependent methyltransferase [Cyanobacteriota bacterium]